MFKNFTHIPLIKTYKTAKSILSIIPETWLEFSAGQNTKTNLSRFKKNIYLSFFNQIFGFLYFLFKSVGLRTSSISKSDIVLFASTQNQFTVLKPIYKEISGLESSFVFPNNVNFSFDSAEVEPKYIKLSFVYLLPIFCLLINRLPSLLNLLWSIDKRLIPLRLKSFLTIYYWLIAHQLIIRTAMPKIIVFSNDHNSENRTLIELCKSLNIKTAYSSCLSFREISFFRF